MAAPAVEEHPLGSRTEPGRISWTVPVRRLGRGDHNVVEHPIGKCARMASKGLLPCDTRRFIGVVANEFD